jgi:hypothetical protein
MTQAVKEMELYSNGVKLDLAPDKFGELRQSNDILYDNAALQARMAEDGYLFFRQLIDPEVVLAARREVLLKYATIGEIDAINHDVMEAIQAPYTFADKVNLRAFTESVRTGMAYDRVVTNEAVFGYLERLLDGDVRMYDFRWPRFVRPSEGCGFHMDGPYMNRGTDKVFTCWIPLGRVTRVEGALIVLENSHRSQRLLNTYAKQDADKEKISWLSTNPLTLQNNLGGRWLSTDFQPGDVLSFGMHMVHGALDNRAPNGRCRLTSDTRYQRADEPLDDRWNGTRPEAHGYDKVFFPGLGAWNNKNFADEWKPVDEYGRLVIPD